MGQLSSTSSMGSRAGRAATKSRTVSGLVVVRVVRMAVRAWARSSPVGSRAGRAATKSRTSHGVVVVVRVVRCGVDSSVAALCGRYVTVIDDGRCGFDDVVSEALSLVRSWPGSHAVGRAVRQESSLHPL